MLTERQRRFVDAYQGNGVQAARAAGYTGNDATLRVRASKLLRQPAVAQALEDRQRVVVDPPATADDAAAVVDVSDGPPALDETLQAFVDVYLANGGKATAAAQAAGFRGRHAVVRGAQFLRRADVQAVLDVARAKEEAVAVASLRERQKVLTAIMRNEKAANKDRIAAVATLTKIDGPARGAGASAAAASGAAAPARPHITLLPSARGPA